MSKQKRNNGRTAPAEAPGAVVLDMAVYPFRAPEAATDSTQTLLQLVNDMRDKLLQVPEHQRTPDAWDEHKRTRYIERLREAVNGRHPPGSIATYQLVKMEAGLLTAVSAKFLNDGLQRLTALRDLRADPTRFGMDAADADNLLRLPISVQHRHYSSHLAAMRDFQYINNGTHLTSFERCRGYLTYMDGWAECWEPLIAEVETAVSQSEARLTAQGADKHRAATERSLQHKRRRDTLAVFYRFLSNDRNLSKYPDIGAKDISKYLDKDNVIERRLAGLMTTMGRDEAGAETKKFRAFIAAETATIEDGLRRTLPPGTALTATNHRWLLHLAVWRRNNAKQRPEYQQFLEAFLGKTQGRSFWTGPEGAGQVTLALAHLGHLPTLADWAGMPGFCERQRQRSKSRSPLLPGYDNSHLEPFVTHGDGPTFPEPAPANRARGAQPVNGERGGV